MNLQEFDTFLARHDWYYSYSDDHRAWKKGIAASSRISEVRKLSPEHETLYKAYVDSMFEDYKTGKPPLTKQEWLEIRKSLNVV